MIIGEQPENGEIFVILLVMMILCASDEFIFPGGIYAHFSI